MTKKDYLDYKNHDQMAIVYEYYKEKFDKFKHKPFLNRKEFDTFVPMYADLNKAYEKACQHFDEKLQCIELRDRDGKLLMIY